jgi:hypothetical protein
LNHNLYGVTVHTIQLMMWVTYCMIYLLAPMFIFCIP